MEFTVLTATASELQDMLASPGSIDSKHLVKTYLAQIKLHNDHLKAVVDMAPEALLMERAQVLDDERNSGKSRNLLHGIPILIKDNMATNSSTGLTQRWPPTLVS
jgi:amidase